MVQFLLDHGAGVNVAGKFGFSPLEAAITEGHDDIAAYLLDHGADPKTQGEAGSALMAAASMCRPGAARLLLSRGVDASDDALRVGQQAAALAHESGPCAETLSLIEDARRR